MIRFAVMSASEDVGSVCADTICGN